MAVRRTAVKGGWLGTTLGNVLPVQIWGFQGPVDWDTSMNADFDWDDGFGRLSVRWVHCRRPNRNLSSWSDFILEKLDLQTFYRKNTKRSQLHFLGIHC